MVLAILEVSQKQAYIFGSKRLSENAARSEQIRFVTERLYLECGATEADNLVYSGGGHIILQFPDKQTAKRTVQAICLRANERYNGMELFAKLLPYDSDRSPGENLNALLEAMERKKSLRRSAFHTGLTGLEAEMPEPLSASYQPKADGFAFREPHNLADLAGTDNFIAVVHIDGNGMGKLAQAVTDRAGDDWERCRSEHQTFSAGVDAAFQSALRRTIEMVEQLQINGDLAEALNFTAQSSYRPIRSVIAAGDDICFVTAGSLGLRCADFFLRALSHPADGLPAYSACAGIALVHTKYPFFRAYQLSEALCSSAKRCAAQLEQQHGAESGTVSAMDWHLLFGTSGDRLEDIRADYLSDDTGDGTGEADLIRSMTLRPVEVEGGLAPVCRTYRYLLRLLVRLSGKSFARSKIKGLRETLKQGEEETRHYLESASLTELEAFAFESSHGADDVLRETAQNGGRVYASYADSCEGGSFYRRSLYFDAIELLDHILLLEGDDA